MSDLNNFADLPSEDEIASMQGGIPMDGLPSEEEIERLQAQQQPTPAPQKNPTMHDLLASLISPKAVQKQFDNTRQLGIDAVKDALIGANNFSEGIAKAVFGKKAAVSGLNKTLGKEKPTGIDQFIQDAVTYAPFGGAGGLAAKVLSKLRVPLAELLGTTAAGSGYGYTMAEPGNEGGSAVQSGLINALTHGAAKGFSALGKASRYRGNLTPEQLAENVTLSDGYNTGLGDVVGNPNLKRNLENTLSKDPASGANNKYHEDATRLVSEGNKIFSDFAGEVPEESLTGKVGEAITNASKKHTEIKNAMYDDTNKIADEIGFTPKTKGFEALANQHKEDILNTNVLQFEPDSKYLLNKIAKFENINGQTPLRLDPATGIPTEKPKNVSLKEANILSSRLNKKANQFLASLDPADKNKGSVLAQLVKTLKDDIKSSISESGHEGLKKSFKDAEENYAKNYSKFLDEDVHDFTHGGKSSDNVLQTFIKTGRDTDQSEHLDKLMGLLDDKEQNLVRAGYFSRALTGAEGERVVDPRKLVTLWGDTKLGVRQKQALVPDAAKRKELDDYVKKVKLNSHALDIMYNPKNGQTNNEFLSAISRKILPAFGGAVAHLPGYIAGEIAQPIIANRKTKYLMSQPVREKLVAKMIESQKNKGKTLNKAQTIAQSLAQLLSQQGS